MRLGYTLVAHYLQSQMLRRGSSKVMLTKADNPVFPEWSVRACCSPPAVFAQHHLRPASVCLPSPLCRHGRFRRSNSVTAGVQADLELEGFPGHVTMEDKGLQFGSSFQRHSEPSTPTQYGAVRTVRTQGLFSYREDYRAPVDTATLPPLPPPEPWLEPAGDTADGGGMSPCRRDGSWFLKLLHTETKRMEGWCKEMEREAEENDLAEESKSAGPRGLGHRVASGKPASRAVLTGVPLAVE